MDSQPAFRKLLTLQLIWFSCAFLGYACFGYDHPDPAAQVRLIDNVTGWLFGVLTSAIVFYYGSSQESKDKVSKEQPPKAAVESNAPSGEQAP